MESFTTALNSMDLKSVTTALPQHNTNLHKLRLDHNVTQEEVQVGTQSKRKQTRFHNQVHQALINHKEGIEKTNKLSQHLQDRMSDVADILREHSETNKNLQHRIQLLEELVLQLSANTTLNTTKKQEAFCATNQPLARDA